MKQWILLLALGLGMYQGWQAIGGDGLAPLHDQPYLVVYGRDSCAYTRRTRESLSEAGIAFQYRRVDEQAVADELHRRMRASGMDTRRYALPVVDLNNALSIRPDNAGLVENARALSL